MPGTLSKGAASPESVMLHGVGFTFGSGIGPRSFSFARVAAASGVALPRP